MTDSQGFTKKLMRQLMKVQLYDDAEEDDGMIRMESKTFNRILLYILLHESRLSEEQSIPHEGSLVNKLDGVLKNSKVEFESMLDMIDKKV